MEIKVITETVALSVVTLANMRNYLEFTATDTVEDALITVLIKGAVKLCEEHTMQAFGVKTIELYISASELDELGRFDLPFYPFGAMTSVTPVNLEGEAQTPLVLNTGYYLTGNQKKSIQLLTNSFLVVSDSNEIWYKIRYTCGYDISNVTDLIPEDYRQAVMEQVRLWYKRADDGEQYEKDLDYSIKRILNITSGLVAI